MVPCQRKTRTQTRMGRAHKSLRAAHVVRCPNCANSKLPHAACTNCGYVRPGLQLQLAKED